MSADPRLANAQLIYGLHFGCTLCRSWAGETVWKVWRVWGGKKRKCVLCRQKNNVSKLSCNVSSKIPVSCQHHPEAATSLSSWTDIPASELEIWLSVNLLLLFDLVCVATGVPENQRATRYSYIHMIACIVSLLQLSGSTFDNFLQKITAN